MSWATNCLEEENQDLKRIGDYKETLTLLGDLPCTGKALKVCVEKHQENGSVSWDMRDKGSPRGI